MDEDEYLSFDGLGLSELVATKQVTAAELLAIAQARADRVNPRINAIVNRLDEYAEVRLGQELTGPYAGVPFLLKDLFQDLAGTPTSAGCRALAGRPVQQTSTVVARWRAAGLVIFGKTNTSEFGAKAITEPKLFGPARNPWNLARTPGGSSGGSAAAVAAGIVPVASATDFGGSIRIPAACTGLVGLKPGRGLSPFGPSDSEPLNGLLTHGVISRSVRDSAAMLDVLAGPDAMAAFAPALPATSFLDDLDRPPPRLRVGYTTYSAIRKSAHPEATRAVEAAVRLLTELGHDVEQVDSPYDDQQLARDFMTILFVDLAVEIARVKRETGAGDEGFEQDTRLMAALGRRIGGVELQAAQERGSEYIAGLARLHATHDLLMTPTIGEPPIKVGSLELPRPVQWLTEGVLRPDAVRMLELAGITEQFIQRNLCWVPYAQLANLTGRPAISIPLYWTPDGLPLGVQFVAPLQGEKLLLRLARQLEVAAPWADRHAPVD